MPISERSHTLRRTVIAGSIAAMVALVISPSDPAMSNLTVHPAWAIALVLGARYGARGLYSVPAIVVGVLVAEWVAGRSEARDAGPADPGLNVLAVLGTIVALAGVGEAHQARGVRLQARLRSAEARAADAEVAVTALSDAAIALRDRSDRSQTSLAFLSDVALRMDDPDPNVAAQAVLELRDRPDRRPRWVRATRRRRTAPDAGRAGRVERGSVDATRGVPRSRRVGGARSLEAVRGPRGRCGLGRGFGSRGAAPLRGRHRDGRARAARDRIAGAHRRGARGSRDDHPVGRPVVRAGALRCGAAGQPDPR